MIIPNFAQIWNTKLGNKPLCGARDDWKWRCLTCYACYNTDISEELVNDTCWWHNDKETTPVEQMPLVEMHKQPIIVFPLTTLFPLLTECDGGWSSKQQDTKGGSWFGTNKDIQSNAFRPLFPPRPAPYISNAFNAVIIPMGVPLCVCVHTQDWYPGDTHTLRSIWVYGLYFRSLWIKDSTKRINTC